MKTLRAKCREEISRRLVPELRRRGFVGPDEIQGNSLIHSYERKTEKQIERLSVQFDKYHRPRFILNVQIDPPEGWAGYEQNGGTMVLGRIAPGGGIGTGAWFRADVPFWKRWFGHTASREEEAVGQALDRLDAIDEWFRVPRTTKIVYTSTLKISAKKKNA